MKKNNVFLFFCLLLGTNVVLVQPGISQSAGKVDYPSRPPLELSWSELDAHIEAGFGDRMIRGEVTYRFTPKHAYVDRLVWAAPRANIRRVALDGDEIAFNLEDDSLRIRFENYLNPGQTSAITLNYEVEPVYGVHFKHSGTLFTSNLPGSVAHWLPGPVHPRVAMPVRLSLEVPEQMSAVANGELQEVVGTEKGQRFLWVSEESIPVSKLGFAVGNFEYIETFSGTKNLRVYHEEDVLDEDQRQVLMQYMVRRLSELERHMRSEMPVSSFQVVVLNDDRWEKRPYAAGLAFLYQSLDNLQIQLSRSLMAQWFGVSLRSEQWQDSVYPLLYQALVAEQTGEEDWPYTRDPLEQAFEVPETVYEMAGMNRWQWARQYLREDQSPILFTALESSLHDFSVLRETRTSSDFSRDLYRVVGRWFEPPEIPEPSPKPDFEFLVHVEEMQDPDRISLEFIPLADITEEKFQLTVYWDHGGEINQEEVVFRGDEDRAELHPGVRVDNLWIENGENDQAEITIEKPYSFWLHQLRRDEDPGRRKQAALALRAFDVDSDLELAVQDMINREEEPEVLAALYRLLAEITSGASGTERRFLEGLDEGHQQVKMACMEALKDYPGSRQVEDQVFSVIQTSTDIELVNKAITTYRHLVDEDPFRDFAIRFLEEDRESLFFTETLIEELFNIPPSGETVAAVQEYLDNSYSFDLRWLTYRRLRREAADMGWQLDFLREFSEDPDPRIRFLTLFSLFELDSQERASFLKNRMSNEYDIRILKRLKEYSD